MTLGGPKRFLLNNQGKTSTNSALAPKGIISGVLWGFFREFFRGSLETLG